MHIESKHEFKPNNFALEVLGVVLHIVGWKVEQVNIINVASIVDWSDDHGSDNRSMITVVFDWKDKGDYAYMSEEETVAKLRDAVSRHFDYRPNCEAGGTFGGAYLEYVYQYGDMVILTLTTRHALDI